MTQEEPRLKPGDIVSHFKRDLVNSTDEFRYLYRIIGFATHTETGEKLVVYQPLYRQESEYGGQTMYCRPYDMFMGPVDKNKYPQAKQFYRLEKFSFHS